MINNETLNKLVDASDSEMLEIIASALQSFMEYLACIYELEIYKMVYSYESVEKEDYQDKITQLDRARRQAHDCVLSNLSILNRIASQNDMESFYDGVVSTERPYRRIAADEVLSFVDEIIKQRA